MQHSSTIAGYYYRPQGGSRLFDMKVVSSYVYV